MLDAFSRAVVTADGKNTAIGSGELEGLKSFIAS
ncbi:MAG: bleomycin hydrolase, partial [Symploca sp. SIO2C1]|nr:bleomycin hydrolase [Symploca sp. SIO2C1]NEP12720.1 bleomycin hydrolase [Symploca sp. SIO2C1]